MNDLRKLFDRDSKPLAPDLWPRIAANAIQHEPGGRSRVALAAGLALALAVLGSVGLYAWLRANPQAHSMNQGSSVADIIFARRNQRGDLSLFLLRLEPYRLVQLTPRSMEATDPAWSRDGRFVAFAATPERGTRAERSIFIMDADGSNVRQVTRGGDDSAPSWSPDGSRIAFTRLRRSSLSVLVVDLEDNGVRQLTSDHFDEHPSWSPDGRTLIFGRSNDPALETWSIMSIRPDGSGLKLLHPGGLNPAWSPDGKRILFTEPLGALAIISADGSGKESLPCPQACPGYVGGSWAGGTVLAWVHPIGVGAPLYRIDLSTNRVTALTQGGVDCCATARPAGR